MSSCCITVVGGFCGSRPAFCISCVLNVWTSGAQYQGRISWPVCPGSVLVSQTPGMNGWLMPGAFLSKSIRKPALASASAVGGLMLMTSAMLQPFAFVSCRAVKSPLPGSSIQLTWTPGCSDSNWLIMGVKSCEKLSFRLVVWNVMFPLIAPEIPPERALDDGPVQLPTFVVVAVLPPPLQAMSATVAPTVVARQDKARFSFMIASPPLCAAGPRPCLSRLRLSSTGSDL